MIERNGYAGFTVFPALPGVTGPIRPIDALTQSVRVTLTGTAFSVRVQISNASSSTTSPHLFVPPSDSFETFAVVTEPDLPLSIPTPSRFVRLIVDSGQVDDARIEESQVDAWSVKLENTEVRAANAVAGINDATSGLLALTLAQQAALVELDQALADIEQSANLVQTEVDRIRLINSVGAASLDLLLLDWTQGEGYEPTAITRNVDSLVTSATVKWPDGASGTLTTTNYNATYGVYDGYTITHSAGKTVTQAAVTRDANGAVTVKPALVVS